MEGENVTGCRLGISYTCTAGFYSDVVECSTLNRRVPGSILGRGMEIFARVRDINNILNAKKNLQSRYFSSCHFQEKHNLKNHFHPNKLCFSYITVTKKKKKKKKKDSIDDLIFRLF